MTTDRLAQRSRNQTHTPDLDFTEGNEGNEGPGQKL
jgi:hypothetical protein